MKDFKCIKCDEVFDEVYLERESDCICKYCGEIMDNQID